LDGARHLGVVLSKVHGLRPHSNLRGKSEVTCLVCPVGVGLEVSQTEWLKERISLGGAVVPLRDSVISNNDDLVPALAQRLIIIFLLRGHLIVLAILFVPLIRAFPMVVRVELDTILVDIFILIVTSLVVVAIPISSIVVGIIPAAWTASIVVGIIPAPA
jgi:hypothetical protein